MPDATAEPIVPCVRPADPPADEPTPSLHRRIRDALGRLGPTAPLAAATAILPVLGGFFIYARLGAIADWLRANPSTAPYLCVAAFGLAGGLALAPTYAMSALCGWSFGFAPGLAATLGGYLLAALLAYALAGLADRGRMMRLIGTAPKWRAVHAGLTRGGFGKVTLVVALVRLAPVAPFSLTNLLMSAARVPLPAYAVGTALGMVPRTALIVLAASELQTLDATPAERPWVFAFGAVTTAVVAVALGLIGKHALARATSTSDEAEPAAAPGGPVA